MACRQFHTLICYNTAYHRSVFVVVVARLLQCCVVMKFNQCQRKTSLSRRRFHGQCHSQMCRLTARRRLKSRSRFWRYQLLPQHEQSQDGATGQWRHWQPAFIRRFVESTLLGWIEMGEFTIKQCWEVSNHALISRQSKDSIFRPCLESTIVNVSGIYLCLNTATLSHNWA